MSIDLRRGVIAALALAGLLAGCERRAQDDAVREKVAQPRERRDVDRIDERSARVGRGSELRIE